MAIEMPIRISRFSTALITETMPLESVEKLSLQKLSVEEPNVESQTVEKLNVENDERSPYSDQKTPLPRVDQDTVVRMLKFVHNTLASSGPHSLEGLYDKSLEQLHSSTSLAPVIDGLVTHAKLSYPVNLCNIAQFYDPENDLIINLLSRNKTFEVYCILRLFAHHWSGSPYTKLVRLILLSTLSKLLVQGKLIDFAYFLHIIISGWKTEDLVALNIIVGQHGHSIRTLISPEDYRRLAELAPGSSTSSAYPIQMADSLIKICLHIGDPLLAASFCIRFHPSIYVSASTLHSCMQALIVFEAGSIGYLKFKALERLAAHFPKSRIWADGMFKRKMIETALELSRGKPPPFANDVFNLASSLPGDPVPTHAVYRVLEKNIANQDTMTAASLWKRIENDYDDFTDHGVKTLSGLLYRFSKERQYRSMAREIAAKIPSQFYGVDGISEPLLLYCARERNIEFAQEIYKQLKFPLRRTVLTSLLHLHLAVKDDAGAEKILLEIKNRGWTLEDHELARIIKSLAEQDIGRAIALIERFPQLATSPKLHATICNAAVEMGDQRTFYEYLEKLRETGTSESYGMMSLIMAKQVGKLENPEDVKRAWLYWTEAGPSTPFAFRLSSLRALLSVFCKRKNDEYVVWTLKELKDLGQRRSMLFKFVERSGCYQRYEIDNLLREAMIARPR